MTSPTAILLVSCPERRGLVAQLANFIFSHNGNIIDAAHHTDLAAGLFLSRLEWQLEGFDLPREAIAPAFAEIASSIQGNCTFPILCPVSLFGLVVRSTVSSS